MHGLFAINMMKNILIVENDKILRHSFEGFLKYRSGFFTVLTAKNSQDALNIIDQLNIDLLLFGFQVPEIDSYNLVTHLEKYHPNIRVIVMMDNASQLFKASFKCLNSTVFFEKTTDIHMLTRRIYDELKINYGGHILGFSLSAFLQMMEMEETSCTLFVRKKNTAGYLYIRNGKLISAKYDNSKGNDAALEILAWKNVSMEIDYISPGVEKDIDMPMMHLLLEARRLADEKQINRPEMRQHERQDCMFALDYELKGRNYHGFLWDISLGGAYIETDQSVPVGAEILLGLNAFNQQGFCRVNARIVRKDNSGIGINFEDLTQEQKEAIDALILNQFRLAVDDSGKN